MNKFRKSFLILLLVAVSVSMSASACRAFSRQSNYVSETSAVIYWQLDDISHQATGYVEYGTTNRQAVYESARHRNVWVFSLGRAAYSSSKSALLGLTRTFALETARDGICVNAICPGPFKTPMNIPVYTDEAVNREFLEKLPIGRWGDPDEMRGLLLYVCSDACSFMTGSSLVIDGGWTAQ